LLALRIRSIVLIEQWYFPSSRSVA